MRRCPVAAWEGWTTKPATREHQKGPSRETIGGPIIQQPSVAIERRRKSVVGYPRQGRSK
jgi:hypothetical protein